MTSARRLVLATGLLLAVTATVGVLAALRVVDGRRTALPIG